MKTPGPEYPIEVRYIQPKGPSELAVGKAAWPRAPWSWAVANGPQVLDEYQTRSLGQQKAITEGDRNGYLHFETTNGAFGFYLGFVVEQSPNNKRLAPLLENVLSTNKARLVSIAAPSYEGIPTKLSRAIRRPQVIPLENRLPTVKLPADTITKCGFVLWGEPPTKHSVLNSPELAVRAWWAREDARERTDLSDHERYSPVIKQSRESRSLFKAQYTGVKDQVSIEPYSFSRRLTWVEGSVPIKHPEWFLASSHYETIYINGFTFDGKAPNRILMVDVLSSACEVVAHLDVGVTTA